MLARNGKNFTKTEIFVKIQIKKKRKFKIRGFEKMIKIIKRKDQNSLVFVNGFTERERDESVIK